MDAKDLPILRRQYHGCWWPGDIRSQVISSHGIDLVILEYSGLSIKNNLFVPGDPIYVSVILVKISSTNPLVPDVTKPSPESILTFHQCSVMVHWMFFMWIYISLYQSWNIFENTCTRQPSDGQ